MDRQSLQARWKGQKERIEMILTTLRKGADVSQLLEESSFLDLRGLPLENVDLAGASLERVDLSFAVFFNVSLAGAVISSEGRRSILSGASFVHCNFAGAQLYGADCTRAYFGHCDLANANFCKAKLDAGTFRSSVLNGADFTATSLRDVNFVHSDLRDLRVSAETTVGVSENLVLDERIPLQAQAETMTYDRFQFADQADAYKNAAGVYGRLADAWEKNGLSEVGSLLRSREMECMQLAQGAQVKR